MIDVIWLIISIVHVWIYIAGDKVFIQPFNIYDAFIIFFPKTMLSNYIDSVIFIDCKYVS